MTSTGSATLAYGRRLPRRRRLRWAAAVAAGAIVCYHGKGRWLPLVRQRWAAFQLDRSQARCLAFSPSPGEVVFTDAAGATVGFDCERVVTYDNYAAVFWRPDVWSDFVGRFGDPVTFRSYGVYTGSNSAAPCLLHERQLPDGERVLACVAVSVRFSRARLQPSYWTLGSLTSSPRLVDGTPIDIVKARPTDPLTIGAARLDSADGTRFDIPYRVGDRSGVIRGRMTADGGELRVDGGWLNADRHVSTTDGTGVRLHEWATPDFVLRSPLQPDVSPSLARPQQMVFAADGRRLIVLKAGHDVAVYDVPARRWCATIDPPAVPDLDGPEPVRSVLSPHGTFAVYHYARDTYGGNDEVGPFVAVRGLTTGTSREVGRFDGPGPHTLAPVFSSDERTFFWFDGDRLHAVDTATWRERASATLPGYICEAAVGPTRIAVTTAPPTSAMADPDRLLFLSAATLAVVGPSARPINNFTFSPDGLQLLDLSRGSCYGQTFPPAGLYSIDVRSGAIRPDPHTGLYPYSLDARLNSSVFSADGRWWAASGFVWAYPGLGDVWRLATPPPNDSADACPAFSPDSHRLATATDAGVAVWSMPR